MAERIDPKTGIIKTQQSEISLRSEPVSISSAGPSSSERIAELEAELARERRELANCERDGQRLSQLLAEEQDTTEALEAALRALVAVEPVATLFTPDEDTWDAEMCLYCYARRDYSGGAPLPVTHTPDCPWVKARALLKRESNG